MAHAPRHHAQGGHDTVQQWLLAFPDIRRIRKKQGIGWQHHAHEFARADDLHFGNLNGGGENAFYIQGKGFFQIQMPTGETAYTRDGTFQLNNAGQLVTHDGFALLPGVSVPTNAVDVTINDSGEVLVKIEGQVNLANVGQIQLATFQNEPGLEAIGDNLLIETPASGSPTVGNPGATDFGSLLQGFLETANVNAVEEISNLISAQRAYEMNSKVIETTDQMMATVTNVR
jgi:flagellar basal-body rod protein FlgG